VGRLAARGQAAHSLSFRDPATCLDIILAPMHPAESPRNNREWRLCLGKRLVMTEGNQYLQAAGMFRILSHPARLRIVDELRRGEACVCRLQAILRRRQPYVSQQLNILREAGIAGSRRDGQFIYYYLEDEGLRQLLEAALGPAGQVSHPASCKCPSCREGASADAGTNRG